jgi:hypothetical protein
MHAKQTTQPTKQANKQTNKQTNKQKNKQTVNSVPKGLYSLGQVRQAAEARRRRLCQTTKQHSNPEHAKHTHDKSMRLSSWGSACCGTRRRWTGHGQARRGRLCQTSNIKPNPGNQTLESKPWKHTHETLEMKPWKPNLEIKT